MDKMWQEILGRQIRAAMDMFENAIAACPDNLWESRMWNDPHMPPGFSEFWYIAYHTLFWLDLYLTGSVEGFTPPAPYTLGELEPMGVLPPRVYLKDELQSYLAHCRQKCRTTLVGLTEAQARKACNFWWTKGDISFADLLVDSMRHVQEHGAQLNMYLGQHALDSSRWVEQAKDD